MKWLRYALILLCLLAGYCDFAQTLKITSITSADKVSGKILEKPLLGKPIELKLVEDSAFVTIPALHKSSKLKQNGTDQYTRTDFAYEESGISVLTLFRTSEGQLSSIKLRMVNVTEAGDKMDVWIVAKP